MERVEELACRLNDGILTAGESEELASLVAASHREAASFVLVMDIEGELRSGAEPRDLSDAVMERIGRVHVEDAVMAAVRRLPAPPPGGARDFPAARGFPRRPVWTFISLALHAACLLLAVIWTLSPGERSGFSPLFHARPARATGGGVSRPRRATPSYEEVLRARAWGMARGGRIHGSLPEIEPAGIPEFPEATDKTAPVETPAFTRIEEVLETDGWSLEAGREEIAAGVYPSRNPALKKRALARFGGSMESESAVLAALKWFERHQRDDGAWSLHDYYFECKVKEGCPHTAARKYVDGDACGTGLALLCFLGAGHTDKAGMFRQEVEGALAYLVTNQRPDGSFSANNYIHAIATMSIIEAYGMTHAADLKKKAQKAVNVILARQNPGMGWTYTRPGPRNDTSVTGWQVMALASARTAGLEIGTAFTGVKNFLDKVTPPVVEEGGVPRLAGYVRYTYNTRRNELSPGGNLRLTAVGMLCRVLAGESITSRAVRAHANTILPHLPGGKGPVAGNIYGIYYATLDMFHLGGKYWKEWNPHLKDFLCGIQRKDGCADGSWDPPERSGIIRGGGRVLSTALACLSLEVYYRYPPLFLKRKA